MKFLVEVVRSSKGRERVLSRLEIDESSPRKAETKAQLLLAPWRNSGATSTRVVSFPRRTSSLSRRDDRTRRDGPRIAQSG